MPLDTLKAVLADVFTSLSTDIELNVVWHAGEPLTAGLDFFKEAFAEVTKANNGRSTIRHRIQTNGVLIDDRWCDLFLAHDVQVGLSVDGPAAIHDLHRHTRKGGGTHLFSTRAMKLLAARGVPYRVICVLSRDSLQRPEDIIDFFIDHGVERVGFNVETIEGENIASSLTGADSLALKDFWIRVLRRIAERESRISVREIDSAVEFVLSGAGKDRIRVDNSPLAMLTVDADGNYYTFSPELAGLRDAKNETYAIGNVFERALGEVTRSERYSSLVADIAAGIEVCRTECRYFRVCGGGSPSNKLAENGTFISGETQGCRLATKVLYDALAGIIPEVADAIQLRRN
jgi:uncharacterized protein